MKIRKILFAAAAAIAVTLASLPAVAEGNEVHLFIGGRIYLGETVLLPGTTYVGLRQFSEEFPGSEVSWDGASRTASVKLGKTVMTARAGDLFIEADGRCIPCPLGVFIRGGRIYVPLRAAAAVFGYSTRWVEGASVALLRRDPSGFVGGAGYYREDEVFWLSRIISAEARGEPMEGKLAVGTVIMNRVERPDYPDTIYGVIFDSKDGVQFTPTMNGTVYLEPDADSVRAAKMCLEGYRVPGNLLFFMNERLAESFWIKNNRVFVASIGAHDFYA